MSSSPVVFRCRVGKERAAPPVASNGGTAKRLRRKRTEGAPLAGSRVGGLSISS